MSLTEREKEARKIRARRRREAKAAGTFVPRGERKRKRREEQREAVEIKVLRHRDKEEIQRAVKKRRESEPKRLKCRFKTQEPVLIKARITGHVLHDEYGNSRYYVMPITDLGQQIGRQWLLHEAYLAPWPRKSKRGK